MTTLKLLREFATIALTKTPTGFPPVIMHSPIAGVHAKGTHFELGKTKDEPAGIRKKFATPAAAVSHFAKYKHGNEV